MQFTKLLVHQRQLPATTINWLVHSAKQKEKAELSALYCSLAPVLKTSKDRLQERASFDEVTFIGNSLSKGARSEALSKDR